MATFSPKVHRRQRRCWGASERTEKRVLGAERLCSGSVEGGRPASRSGAGAATRRDMRWRTRVVPQTGCLIVVPFVGVKRKRPYFALGGARISLPRWQKVGPP